MHELVTTGKLSGTSSKAEYLSYKSSSVVLYDNKYRRLQTKYGFRWRSDSQRMHTRFFVKHIIKILLILHRNNQTPVTEKRKLLQPFAGNLTRYKDSSGLIATFSICVWSPHATSHNHNMNIPPADDFYQLPPPLNLEAWQTNQCRLWHRISSRWHYTWFSNYPSWQYMYSDTRGNDKLPISDSKGCAWQCWTANTQGNSIGKLHVN